MLVYGRNVAERIFRDGKLFKKVRKIYIEDNYYKKIENSLDEFLKSKVKISRKCEIDDLCSSNHQGIIVDIEDYQYKNLSSLNFDEINFVVVLDHIVDPHNLGAIIRTAVAAGVDAVIIPNDRQVLINSTVAKTSVGAIYDINIVLVSNINNAINTLKSNGFWVYGTTMDGDNYSKIDYSGKTCLVIGNEEKGISKLVRDNCDFLVTIPLSSNIDSLNASVAAGIMIYEVVRNRK